MVVEKASPNNGLTRQQDGAKPLVTA